MRKPRILLDGGIYHVTAKINRGKFIFDSDEIKYLFLDIVKRAKKKYKFSLTNFVIMNNHVHFIIEPKEKESLSRIMQWILSVFAMYYNKIHKIGGHVWWGRFWSRILENIKQLFDTFRYISENPVKAEIVNTAEEYKFGGFFQILKGIFDIVEKPEYDFLKY
jgi:putative transposase